VTIKCDLERSAGSTNAASHVGNQLYVQQIAGYPHGQARPGPSRVYRKHLLDLVMGQVPFVPWIHHSLLCFWQRWWNIEYIQQLILIVIQDSLVRSG
jgi:hypothetical protein